MADRTARKQRGRPFPKGISPNPNGRPRTPAEMKEAFKAATPEAIDYLVKLIRNKKARTSDRIRACEIIIDHGLGKAPQEIQFSGDAPLTIVFDPILRQEFAPEVGKIA
jgi:hypothetical protein